MSAEASRRDLEAKLVAKAWKDKAFAAALQKDAKGAIKSALGVSLPDAMKISVLTEDANTVYIVMPEKPKSTSELSDDQLEAVAGGITPSAAVLITVAAGAGSAGLGMGVSQGRRAGW